MNNVVEWVAFVGTDEAGRQVLVTIWADEDGNRIGELATRSASFDIWSAPVELVEHGHG